MHGINKGEIPIEKKPELKLNLNFKEQRNKTSASKQSFVVFMYDDINTLALINQFDEAVRNYHNGLNNGVEIKEL
jgi:hypothetical protein